ncbi:MAG: hypothetical protein GXO57_06275 [Thermodesulfobacteria bacterium]|nr:hypothetical protein [Thermodesulfobacteriota bacterium]
MRQKAERKRRYSQKFTSGRCDFCGEEKEACYRCSKCGFTICQRCFIENQQMFTRSGVTWVCPNCLNWETL